MENSNFMLFKDPESECRDLIYHRESSLRIKVICLDDQGWEADPDELQLYADNNGEKLVFETIDFRPEEPGLVIEAIRWYANYIGNPQLEIVAELDE